MKAIIQMNIDYKVIRKVLVLMEEELLSDEQIAELLGSKPIVLDPNADQMDQFEMAVAALLLAQTFEKKEPLITDPPKSKFAQRLEEAKRLQTERLKNKQP